MEFIFQKRNTSTNCYRRINAGLASLRTKIDALSQPGSIREELKVKSKKTAHDTPQS